MPWAITFPIQVLPDLWFASMTSPDFIGLVWLLVEDRVKPPEAKCRGCWPTPRWRSVLTIQTTWSGSIDSSITSSSAARWVLWHFPFERICHFSSSKCYLSIHSFIELFRSHQLWNAPGLFKKMAALAVYFGHGFFLKIQIYTWSLWWLIVSKWSLMTQL